MVIRMRHNRSQTKQRRSHHALKTPTLQVCSNCGENHRPHHMCLSCGFYNGRQVLDLQAKAEKRTARMKAKQDRIKADLGEAEPVSEAVNEPTPQVVEAPQEALDAKAAESEKTAKEREKHAKK